MRTQSGLGERGRVSAPSAAEHQAVGRSTRGADATPLARQTRGVYAAPLALLLLTGCYQDMATQPSYRPLEESELFRDKRSARPIIAGTVARGQLLDTALTDGRDEKGEPVTEFPFPMAKELLKRGEERYNIYCAVCHGLTGHGDGRIVKRGFTEPPDYVKDLSRAYQLVGKKVKLTDVPVGHIYEVVTKGFGAMPDYASQIPIRDRWAITGYVRALQYSQSPEFRTLMKQREKGSKK